MDILNNTSAGMPFFRGIGTITDPWWLRQMFKVCCIGLPCFLIYLDSVFAEKMRNGTYWNPIWIKIIGLVCIVLLFSFYVFMSEVYSV